MQSERYTDMCSSSTHTNTRKLQLTHRHTHRERERESGSHVAAGARRNAQYAVSCAQTWCNYCKLRLKSSCLSLSFPLSLLSPPPCLLAFCSRQRHLYLMTFQHRVRVRRDVFLRLFWLHAYCIKSAAAAPQQRSQRQQQQQQQ